MASGPLPHALGMILVGLLLGMVGTDVNPAIPRYTFDVPMLANGINFVVLAMGIFGLGEIAANLENEGEWTLLTRKVTNLMPTREDWKGSGKKVGVRNFG